MRSTPPEWLKNRRGDNQCHSSDNQRSTGNKLWDFADKELCGRDKKCSDGDEPWIPGGYRWFSPNQWWPAFYKR